MNRPSYQAVEDIVSIHEAMVGAAEAHGMLAGMLCVNPVADCEQWLSQVFSETRDGLGEADVATLHQLYDQTRKFLEAVDFSFALFLPEDDAALAERAQALSGWCQGFLYGVGYAGAALDWPDDCAEILRDLADISQLDANASGEEDEEAYTEISEFVRVGVQLIRGDLRLQSLPKSRLH